MTFRKYLKSIQGEDSPRGDLASDLLNDKQLKGKYLGVYSIRKYLQSRGSGARWIYDLLDEVWRDYKASRILYARTP